MSSVIYVPSGPAAEYSHLAVNLYHGCRFACKYCYAPAIARMKRAEWAADPKPKKDILERLERDAKRMKGDKRTVLLCYTSDPYQSPEAAALTRQALEILEKYEMTLTVLTKGGMLATNDFDILKRNDWQFGTTLSLSCEQVRQEWEPGAASIEDRINAIEKACGWEIKTWVSVEPVIVPEQALNVIEHLAWCVDFWKIGKMNHRKMGIDWAKFLKDVTELCDRLGLDYYIKKELAEYGKVTDVSNS